MNYGTPKFGTPAYFGNINMNIAINDVSSLVYTYVTNQNPNGPVPIPAPTDVVWSLQSGQTQLAEEDGIYLSSQNPSSIVNKVHAAFILFKFDYTAVVATQGIKFKGYFQTNNNSYGALRIWNETNQNYEWIGTLTTSNREIVAHISQRQIDNGLLGGYIYIVAEANSVSINGGQILRADYIRVNGMGYEV
jgi:hypothetical protein